MLYFKSNSLSAEDTSLPHQWPEDEIKLLEDELLIAEIISYKADVEAEWEVLRNIAKKYPDQFPPSKVTDEALNWCTNTILTRCFGIGLSFTMLVPFADCFNHYNIDTGSEMFCPKLHQVSKIDITNPIYPAAMEYQTSERMIVEYGDFYKNHTSHREIKPSKTTKDKMERKYNRYWKKVATREKYLSRPIPDESDKENKVSPLSILEEEKSKEIWNCSYSSSTDTEDDEDESDEEVFDVVEEAVHSIKTSDGKIDRKYLLNVDERYAYKSTFDKYKRPLLIVQDRKQWKKRSFS